MTRNAHEVDAPSASLQTRVRHGAHALKWLLRGLLWLAPAWVSAATWSDEERSFIAKHGPVKVVVVAQIGMPYYAASTDGSPPVGFAIDLMALLGERSGLRFDYQTVQTPAQAAELLRSGQADMTPLVRLSPERETFLLATAPLVPLETVFVTRREATDVTGTRDFQGRRVAVVTGTAHEEMLARDYPGATIERHPTHREMLVAVSTGRADLALATMAEAVYHIEVNLLSNLHVRRLPDAERASMGPAVVIGKPLLRTVIAKALADVTPAERTAIARRWLPAGVNASFAQQGTALSEAEHAWVVASPGIRIGFDARFAPFTVGTGIGGFEGLGADVMRAAADRVGLRIVGQDSGSFADVLDRARRGEVDVVVGMARNAQREAEFEFVGPFAKAPTVMLLRDDSPINYTEPDDMVSGKVGLLRSHFLLPQLRSRKPRLEFVEYDDQRAVLKALADGAVQAAIGNVHVVTRLVDEGFAGRLRVSGVVRDGDSELYFGVPRRAAPLARVLEKGMLAVSPAELAEFSQRWLLVRLEPGLSWPEVLRWVVPLMLGLVVAGLLFDRARRRRIEAVLQASRQELAQLSHRLMEQERQTTRRVAQALHDRLGQVLGALRLHTDALEVQQASGRATDAGWPRVRGLVDQAVNEVRGVLVDLRPPLLEQFGLAAALDNELQTRRRDAGSIELKLHAAEPKPGSRWPADVEYAAFMIAREAVGNALAHAGVTRITCALDGDATHLLLRIDSDGTGSPAPSGRPGHLSVVSMRERAMAIGAEFDVGSNAGVGVRVSVDWRAAP